MTLRRSEDAFVDDSVRAGDRARRRRCCGRAFRAPFSISTASRSNSTRRCSRDGCPDFANTRSLRVAAGLGVIPRVVGDAQPIYRGADAGRGGAGRIAALHRPYHARLAALIETAQSAIRLRRAARLPFDALDLARRRRLRHRARRPLRLQRGAVDRRHASKARLRARGLVRAPQQALCRRLHHRALRRAGRGPPRVADRDQPRLYMDERHDRDWTEWRRRSDRRRSARDGSAHWRARRCEVVGRRAGRRNEAARPAKGVARVAASKKRRPPEGGLSLGRKRPKEGICDVSHRNNIALHRNKCKRFSLACQPCGQLGARGVGAPSAASCGAKGGRLRRKKRRPPVGGLEFREETPKEGICGKRRTRTNLAQNAANARSQTLFNRDMLNSATFLQQRRKPRFCSGVRFCSAINEHGEVRSRLKLRCL